jgi:hypothetical protein
MSKLIEKTPTFMVDSKEIFTWLSDKKIPVLYWQEYDPENPSDYISICSKLQHFERLPIIAQKSRVLVLAQLAFDPSNTAVLYSLECLLKSDFLEASKERERFKSKIQRKHISFTGSSAHFFCQTQKNTTISSLDESRINSRSLISVAEYFEAGLESQGSLENCPYKINGEGFSHGITIAKNPDKTIFNFEGIKRIKNLINSSTEAKIYIEVKDNLLHKCQIDDEDVLADLAESVGGESKLQVIEFSRGFNGKILDGIDYRINSQMNEGVQGIHLGVGDGISGYHIDFLFPEVDFAD